MTSKKNPHEQMIVNATNRSKGGKTTASKYDMRQRGRLGLQALADRYFQGCTKKAGKALSRIGNFTTDPFPLNGAWRDPIYSLPPELFAKVMGHCEVDDPDGVAF